MFLVSASDGSVDYAAVVETLALNKELDLLNLLVFYNTYHKLNCAISI